MTEWFEGESVYEDPPPLILPVAIWVAVIVGVIAGLVFVTRGFAWI